MEEKTVEIIEGGVREGREGKKQDQIELNERDGVEISSGK